MKIIKLAVLLFIVLLLNEFAAAVEKASSPAEHPYVGTVLQSITEGKYTYLELDVDGKNVWIATMPAFLTVTVDKGDQVEYIGGLIMNDFTSKSLNRTFASILFITRIKVLMKNSVMLPKDEYHAKTIETQSKFVPVREGEIKKPDGGKTVAEIYSEREELKDRKVILRAKVTKMNKNIMKRNWITLNDGTGTAPDDKIVLITTGTSNINDVVTVKGFVRTDVNLGGNYKYRALLEDAHDVDK